MRALVVDDEPLARRRLRRMLEAIDGVEVVGEAEDGSIALSRIRELRPDVVFLDIRMPGLDGLSLAARETDLPSIVFVTAYHEYAVRAFDAEAVDYLLKPVEAERLRTAVNRVRTRGSGDLASRLEAIVHRLGTSTGPPRISARSGSSTYLFDPRNIVRFRAEQKYVVFRQGKTDYLLEESLASLERRLEPWGFLRPHRAELVNMRHVVALHGTGAGAGAALELTTGDRVPVSRRRLADVRRALGMDAP